MPPSPAYAELAVTTNFTFLRGASHPEEFVARAAELGHAACAIADTNTLGGVVRAHLAAKDAGIPLAVGARVRLTEPLDLDVLAFASDRASYARLCRLLTLGKRRAEKGGCRLAIHDLLDHERGLLGVVIPPPTLSDDLVGVLDALRAAFTRDRLWIGASRAHASFDRERLALHAALASHLRLDLACVNDVRYHDPSRRPLQDVLTCVRHGCTLDDAGLRLAPNAERHPKPAREMARLLAGYEHALDRSAEIASRASAFSLDQLRYEYPDEVVPAGSTPSSHLARLTRAGALERYPRGVPPRVRAQIDHELALIDDLRYAPYFLTCHDIVRFARARGILCQGRGAAANSAVCFCLGITSVDPDRIDVLFERFVSRERDEPPDIDIDFEHERREEVIQHIYSTYGRDRAALTAEVITYRGRSAVREVGKALGLSLDAVDSLAKSLEGWGYAADAREGRADGTPDARVIPDRRLRELGLDPSNPTLRRVLALTAQVQSFPRHRSQHVGGFVISRGPLCESVPIENAAMPDRTVIEWDKDDLDALGMLKIDILGLGMLTCIRKSLALVDRPLTLATVPPEDPAVYDMVCAADTIGVFQIESRAQMSMLPRLRPRCFYDLVIEVAIVRPGPIQGDMVHPYLRRRSGLEPVSYPHPDVERVLSKTLGVPLFQEQVMKLAIVAAGFTPGQADQLRRAMAAWKRKGDALARFERQFIDGMIARGYPVEFARRCFEQVKGFSEYGFPESHAASFALLVYVSCWLKRHHPAAFACALLNSQPMGFYQPAQIVRDAREHAVEVRPIDVNSSDWDCTLEPTSPPTRPSIPPAPSGHRLDWGLAGPALRLGMRLVAGLHHADALAIARSAHEHGPFSSIEALHRASGVRASSLRTLARADAFGSMGLDRQAALWRTRALRDERLPLFERPDAADELDPAPLPPPLPADLVRHDYDATGLSLKAHPITHLRPSLDERGVARADALRSAPHASRVAVAGVVTCRQRPATASGVLFMTIEDESGFANLIILPHVYDAHRAAARHSTMVLARGRVERQGEVVHVHVRTIERLETSLAARSRDFH